MSAIKPIGKKPLMERQEKIFNMYKDLFKLIWSGYDGIIFTYHLEKYFDCKKDGFASTIKAWEDVKLIDKFNFGRNTVIKLKKPVSRLLDRGSKSTKVTNFTILRSAMIGELYEYLYSSDFNKVLENLRYTNLTFNTKANMTLSIVQRIYKIYKEKGWDTYNLTQHFNILKERMNVDRLNQARQNKSKENTDEKVKNKLDIPAGHVDLWNLAMNNVYVQHFCLEDDIVIINMAVLNFTNHTAQRIAKILDLTYQCISDMLYDRNYDVLGDNSKVHYKLNITVFDLDYEFHSYQVGYYNSSGAFVRADEIPYEDGYYDENLNFTDKNGIVRTFDNKIGYYDEKGKFIEGKKPYQDYYYSYCRARIKSMLFNKKPYWSKKGFHTRGGFLFNRDGNVLIGNNQFSFKDKNENEFLPDGTVIRDIVIQEIKDYLLSKSKVCDKFTFQFVNFNASEKLLSRRPLDNLLFKL